MRKTFRLLVFPDFYFVLALSLFIIPAQWVLGWVVASTIHELFHLIMMIILKIRIPSIALHAHGAVIEAEEMTSFQELLCSLAGPFGGLCALVLLRVMPETAICAALQSAYNLLPVYPLDGGRAFRAAVMCIWKSVNTQSLSAITNFLTVLFFIVFGMWLSVKYKLGMLPIIFPSLPLILAAYKNSLQSRRNNSTICKYLSYSERTFHI